MFALYARCAVISLVNSVAMSTLLLSTELVTKDPAPLLPDCTVCAAPLSRVASYACPFSFCSALASAKVDSGTCATVRDCPLS